MPGDGGWITSENAHLFEGQFPDVDVQNGPGEEGGEDVIPLGPGAGTTREREVEDDGINGTTAADEDTKWQRTG